MKRSLRILLFGLLVLSISFLLSFTASATQTAPNPKLTLTVDPADCGTVTVNAVANPDGSYSVPAGETVTIKAEGKGHYAFVSWDGIGTLADSSKPQISFAMPSADLELKAKFREEYAVFVDGKKIASYPPESDVSLEANAVTGMKFVSWELEKGTLPQMDLTKEKLSFKMPKEDLYFVSKYEAVEYTLQIRLLGKGSVTVDGKSPEADGSYRFTAGEELHLLARPAQGYSFVLWSTTGSVRLSDYVSADPVLTCPAEDFTVTAQFAAEIKKLTITCGEGGDVLPQKGTMDYGVDYVLDLTAVPDKGYVFDHWETSAASTAFSQIGKASTSFTMPNEDCTVKAVFRKAVVAFQVSAEKGGSVQGGKESYSFGEKLSLTAVPESGYRFVGWSCDRKDLIADPEKNPIDLVVPEGAVALKARFEKIEEGYAFPWIPVSVILSLAAVAIVLIVVSEKNHWPDQRLYRKHNKH